MKTEKQPFVPLLQRFEEEVQALPSSERIRRKAQLKQLRNVVRVASGYLFWSKFAPEVEKDSRFIAKWASQGLKAHKRAISRAAERNDKRFFIDLGKCLSDEIDNSLYYKIAEDVALIFAFDPSIPAKDGVRLLEKFGYPRITEEHFRVLKGRLKRALAKFGLEIAAQKQRAKRKLRRR
jgi:hypothetical protein